MFLPQIIESVSASLISRTHCKTRADCPFSIEILISGPFTKGFKEDPEGLANAIGDFNADICVEAFLNELQSILPSDDDVGLFIIIIKLGRQKLIHFRLLFPFSVTVIAWQTLDTLCR